MEDGQRCRIDQILLVLFSYLLHRRALILLVAGGGALVRSRLQSPIECAHANFRFSGQYLSIVRPSSILPISILFGALLKIQTAMEHGTVDTELLLYASVGRLGCAFSGHALRYFKSSVEFPLNLKIKKHYSIHIFENMARLDVPTFDDPLVQTRLDTATASSRSSHSLAWDTITVIIAILTAAVRLASQLSVLMKVVGGQRDGALFVVLHFGQELFRSNFRTGFDLFYAKGLCSHLMPGEWSESHFP